VAAPPPHLDLIMFSLRVKEPSHKQTHLYIKQTYDNKYTKTKEKKKGKRYMFKIKIKKEKRGNKYTRLGPVHT